MIEDIVIGSCLAAALVTAGAMILLNIVGWVTRPRAASRRGCRES